MRSTRLLLAVLLLEAAAAFFVVRDAVNRLTQVHVDLRAHPCNPLANACAVTEDDTGST